MVPSKGTGTSPYVCVEHLQVSQLHDVLTKLFDTQCAQVEARLRQLEGKALGALSARKTGTDPQKYDKFRSPETPGMVTTPRAYNVEGDVALETPKSTETKEKKEKKDKSEKKEKKDKSEKKEKKRKSRSEEDGTPKEKGSESEKKKKKREKKEG